MCTYEYTMMHGMRYSSISVGALKSTVYFCQSGSSRFTFHYIITVKLNSDSLIKQEYSFILPQVLAMKTWKLFWLLQCLVIFSNFHTENILPVPALISSLLILAL